MSGTTESAPTTSDPIEIAMEAEASGAPATGVAHEVLRRQSQLLAWQIASERAGFALKVALGAAALALIILLAWAAWDASRASGTVISPFDSTPELEAQGLSGKVIANEVASRVAAMQAATGSDRKSRSSTSSIDQINVVIPQTGISIGEAQRLLRAWLGHETRISGSLRPDGAGALVVTMQIDGRRVDVPAPPAEQRSAEAWLDAAAGAAMRESDPYRYAVRLMNSDRVDEAEKVYLRLARTGAAADRAWGWTGLAQVARYRGDYPLAIAEAETAFALDARLDSPLSIMGYLHRLMGHDEQSREDWRRAVEAAKNGAVSASDPRNRLRQRQTYLAACDNDWLAVRSAFEGSMSRGRWGQSNYPPNQLWLYEMAGVRLHEWNTAARLTRDLDPLAGELGGSVKVAELSAAERWADLEALLAQPLMTQNAAADAQVDLVFRRPWQAWLAARAGRTEEARALIGETPLDCYPCVRMRGRIAARAGQPAEADRWFAEAVRQGPSLADADFEWAEVKLARGDPAGARVLAEQAARKAPHWADPVKLQGDLHLRAGDATAAARAYAAANKFAPRWGALHLKWGEALAKLGRADEARAKWRAAATMDLSPADRAGLKAHGV